MKAQQKKAATKLAAEVGLTAEDVSRLFKVDPRQVQRWLDERKKQANGED